MFGVRILYKKETVFAMATLGYELLCDGAETG